MASKEWERTYRSMRKAGFAKEVATHQADWELCYEKIKARRFRLGDKRPISDAEVGRMVSDL